MADSEKQTPSAVDTKTVAQQKPAVAPKPIAHAGNKKKIRIDPMNDAQEIAYNMLTKIRGAMKSPQTTYTVVRGIAHFNRFEGTCGEHTFVVKYTPATKNSINDKLYVSYDDFEFEVQEYYFQELTDFFKEIEQHIKDNFIYDLNSKTYVPRPKKQSSLGNLFTNLFAVKAR